MNKKIIESFTILSNNHRYNGDHYKMKVYDNVIKIIKELNWDITSSDQLKGIPGIGPKTLEKIKTILEHGSLDTVRDIQRPKYKSKMEDINNLTTIYGVGIESAKKLYDLGYHSVESLLREKLEKLETILNHNQLLGLKYYYNLQERITRKESEVFVDTLKDLFGTKYSFELLGSYRRELESSGDIDLLISDKKNIVDIKPVVEILLKAGIIIGTFGLRDHFFSGIIRIMSDSGHVKICSLDLKSYTKEEYPFALLYFTGSGKFNIEMRKNAKIAGFKLSDHGLLNIHTNTQIPCNTEKDIFNELGMEWVSPRDRL